MMEPGEVFRHLLDGLIEFLTFEWFVTPAVLLVSYYLGALIIPIALVVVSLRVNAVIDLLGQIRPNLARLLEGLVRPTRRLILAMIAAFLLGELIWRVMFEFFFAYFGIWSALQTLSGP
jgi:sorbitol-specific phosphotransferase system component IIC